MSWECPPAAINVAVLYQAAADKVEIWSEINKICEAVATGNIDFTKNIATITAQCQANISDYWKSATIFTPEGTMLMTITLDELVEVKAGDTIILSITLTWR